ncbi:MAG: hypothetical protein WC796_01950 [Candidatus Pacearchaeota archaeon]|jgi:hypothetical protein
MTTEAEAKYWRDKSVFEGEGQPNFRDPVNKNLALSIGGISPENYEKLMLEKDISPEYLEVLKNPNIFNEITENEFDKKIVGEIEARKVIFLCACGRLVENCQIASYNLLVNDEAGTGKDYVVGAVLEILPTKYYIHKTRISPAVFTYWHTEEEWTWDGKVFYPEDISEMVLNSDVFKVMTSKGSSATVTIKQKAVDIEIKGKPVMITTTASAIPSPELIRRFVILNLDSSEEQTKAIMKRHSEYKKKGIVPGYYEYYTEVMKHLKRVKVKVPFADLIDKYLPVKNVIMRTHYPRFLDFIAAAAAFHQFQRKIDEEGYILAEKQDYEIARLCFLKLCSNKYMIPLTINQKHILETFENEPQLTGSASMLHDSKMKFMSLPALQTNLGFLVKYGLLEMFTDKDTWNRDITIYSISKSYRENEKINLPEFEELTKIDLTPLEPLIPQENKTGAKGIQGIKPLNDIKQTKIEEINFSETLK